MASRPRGATVVMVTVLALTAACGGDDAAPATVVETTDAAAAPPADLDVFVEFPRYLHAQRQLEIAFDNHAGSDLTVTRWAIRSPMFEPVDATMGASRIPARQRRDLKVDFGPAVCPAPEGASTVDVAFTSDGASFDGTIEIDAEPLARIHRSECGQQHVHDVVDLSFAQEFEVVGDVLTTSLDASLLVDTEPVVIDSLRGSVIIDVDPVTPASPLATLDGATPTASIPAAMRVVRCDPHAVTESKKTFQFATWVTIGDGEQVYTVVEATGALRDELQRLIDQCVLAEFEMANS